MIVFPNAKINLGLKVISKRNDGFHNIETCFYPTKWCDVLEIVESDFFQFTSSGIDIPGANDSNICIKAYNLIKQDFNLPPVKIHLHKIIPIGAGLGGGSSDAAYTISALNEKFKLGLSFENMKAYAKILGSDCAFFIENKPVFAYEKGDTFKNIKLNIKGYFLVIIYPKIHVATSTAYSQVSPSNLLSNIESIVKSEINLWKNFLYNDFETSFSNQYPEIEQIKGFLYAKGALYSSMSGSGSSIYAIFKEETDLLSFMPVNYDMWGEYCNQ